jgi:hypothetical protein
MLAAAGATTAPSQPQPGYSIPPKVRANLEAQEKAVSAILYCTVISSVALLVINALAFRGLMSIEVTTGANLSGAAAVCLFRLHAAKLIDPNIEGLTETGKAHAANRRKNVIILAIGMLAIFAVANALTLAGIIPLTNLSQIYVAAMALPPLVWP